MCNSWTIKDNINSHVCFLTGPVTPEPLTCGAGQFQCVHSFQCVPLSWRCDGEEDCADQSDEEQCPSLVPGTLPPQDHCPHPDQYQCFDNTCLPSLLRCDRVSDCPYGEDEYSCRKGPYLCVLRGGLCVCACRWGLCVCVRAHVCRYPVIT